MKKRHWLSNNPIICLLLQANPSAKHMHNDTKVFLFQDSVRRNASYKDWTPLSNAAGAFDWAENLLDFDESNCFEAMTDIQLQRSAWEDCWYKFNPAQKPKKK